MPKFRKNVLLNNAPTMKKSKTSYEWEGFLSKKNKLVANVNSFSLNLLAEYNETLKEGVVFEVRLDDYKCTTEHIEIRWFATVISIHGYRVLARYLGAETDEEDFYINFLSGDVHSVGHAQFAENEGKQRRMYCPPPFIMDNLKQDEIANYVQKKLDSFKNGLSLARGYDNHKKSVFKSNFTIGNRIELLNYQNSREIRIARIKNICGRRLNVLIEQDDLVGEVEENDDRQMNLVGNEYWIDQDSFFIFPVGWAEYNNFDYNATEEYKEHATRIAKALKEDKVPQYSSIDTTPDLFRKISFDSHAWSQVKKNQKLELIDPLDQTFQNLKVATVLDFCQTQGYLIIGIDGPDQLDESLPLYIVSPFIFPVGYAEKHGLNLTPPSDWEDGKFSWAKYMAKENTEPLPIELFKPENETRPGFEIGMKLEAADMCENQFICPATVKQASGRTILVGFDGWSNEYDELYDVDSHDIFPIGWCEIHGHCLQQPTSKR